MKNFTRVLFAFLLIACGGDDEDNQASNFETEIQNLTTESATISWNAPSNFSGDVIYRVVLENETVADGLQSTEYTFGNLSDNRAYSGTIFAESNNDEQTFSNFSFTTAPITVLSGTATLTRQAEVDNFQYTDVLRLEILGSEITNLDGLANLEIVRNEVLIENTSLTSLDGLSITSNITPNSDFPSIKILDNNNLTNISDISSYFQVAENVSLINNTSLSNINNIVVLKEKINSLTISNCPVNNIPLLPTKEYYFLTLIDLPLLNFEAFSNIENITQLRIHNLSLVSNFEPFSTIDKMSVLNLKNLPNITNLNGLNNLIGLSELYVNDCINFEDFDGLSNLSTSFFDNNNEVIFSANNNPNLTDFCSLSNWMNNTSIYSIDQAGEEIIFYFVTNNAYNPTEDQVESTTECSL